jgi:hypothetical protein
MDVSHNRVPSQPLDGPHSNITVYQHKTPLLGDRKDRRNLSVPLNGRDEHVQELWLCHSGMGIPQIQTPQIHFHRIVSFMLHAPAGITVEGVSTI